MYYTSTEKAVDIYMWKPLHFLTTCPVPIRMVVTRKLHNENVWDTFWMWTTENHSLVLTIVSKQFYLSAVYALRFHTGLYEMQKWVPDDLKSFQQCCSQRRPKSKLIWLHLYLWQSNETCQERIYSNVTKRLKKGFHWKWSVINT